MTGRWPATPPYVPAEATLKSGWFTVEPTRMMQAEGYPFEHEIRVALPQSYADSTHSYPVLWVTDNALELALSVIGVVELILVGIGPSQAAGGFIRRAYDFYPYEDFSPLGPAVEAARKRDNTPLPSAYRGGGAPRFLDFLIDDVRPALAADYRMDPDDHALEGFSAGGWFAVYALLMRPGAFAKFIAGAPSLYFCQDLIWKIEEEYAAAHDDLPGKLFFGIGDGEMTVDAHIGCFSSMAKMVERLTFRNYPSLELTAKIFPGETHTTGRAPAISNGVRVLWGDSLIPEWRRAAPWRQR